MNETLFIQHVPADVLIGGCLFIGAVARLCDHQQRKVGQALTDLLFGQLVGAGLTGFSSILPFLNRWKMASFWWIAIMSAFFATRLVGVISARLDELEKMSFTEFFKVILSSFTDELKSLITYGFEKAKTLFQSKQPPQ